VVNADLSSAIVLASLFWISDIENAGIKLKDIINFNKKRAVKTALLKY
jgi:hypothetical protein